MAEEVGQATLRAQFIDKAIKQIAPEKYVMMQALAVEPTSAWTNYFWRETRTALAGTTLNDEEGVPRLAQFPNANASWEKVESWLSKYGIESTISWEDMRTSEIDVLTRTSIKLAEAIALSVDRAIYNALVGDTDIQTINLYTLAGTSNKKNWETGASRAIIEDLFLAAEKMKDYNLPTGDLMCFISPKDKTSTMSYLASTGAQYQKIAEDITRTGEITRIAGISLIECSAVAASKALVVIPKRCGTWRENFPLSTTTTEDPYKAMTIRVAQVGTAQVHEPKAVVLISGTQP